MSKSRKKSPLHSLPAKGRPITPLQRKFNALVDRLAEQRQLLAAWQAQVPEYERFWGQEIQPLLERQDELSWRMVELLDQPGDSVSLTPEQRETLGMIVLDLLPGLENEENRARIKALFERHGTEDFDNVEREAKALLRADIEQEFGITLPEDFDVDSPEALQQLLDELPEDAMQDARQLPEQVTRSVRGIYRKLAGDLHPDREMDAAERERKTGLMQRVNQAYDQGDLLELLELQLELEQIRPGQLGELPEDKLGHFVQLLGEQLAALEDDIRQEEQLFRERFGIDPQQAVNPRIVKRLGRELVAMLHEELGWMNEDLERLAAPEALPAWLTEQRELIAESQSL